VTVFADIWTSGECAYRLFSDPSSDFAALGSRCFVVTNGFAPPFSGEVARLTHTELDDCDFVLMLGLSHRVAADNNIVALKPGELQDIHTRALARKLVVVCCNPDLVVVRPDKTFAIMPGEFARQYAEAGGPVRHVGKPHPHIYELARAAASGRVLTIGDSLAHDVRGAAGAGLDSLLVCGGVHHAELGLGTDTDALVASTAPVQPLAITPESISVRPTSYQSMQPTAAVTPAPQLASLELLPAAVAALCDRHGVAPTFIVERVRW
jgi:ribonucleotide monophosphatase NagD (HAD superfamily)